jgi:hypothetical protein
MERDVFVQRVKLGPVPLAQIVQGTNIRKLVILRHI